MLNGEQRRARAANEFQGLSELAAQHGLKLRQISYQHYQLSPVTADWLLNLYPGNCRIFADRNQPKRAPYLDFEGIKWSLADVVQATIEHQASAKEGRAG